MEPGGSWPAALAEYIRHNDQTLVEQSDAMLSAFEEELVPCESFDEFCDVAGECVCVCACVCEGGGLRGVVCTMKAEDRKGGQEENNRQQLLSVILNKE